MKDKIINNLGYKILAVLLSLILWLIVININDPVTDKNFSGIPVDITNAEAINAEGKVYEVLEGTETVTVTISAKRSVIDALSKDDIHAVADMKELTFMNTVGIKPVTTKYSDKIISLKTNPESLKVKIENMKKVQLVITPLAVGEPAEGYVLGNMSTEETLVRLTGPESAISEIKKVLAVVDVNGMSSDISTKVELKLYDEEERLIENPSIVKNIDSVRVNVPVLTTKEVPVVYETSGTPADGYMLTGVVESTVQNVLIAGSKKTVEGIKQIEIPPTLLDVTGKSSDMVTVIDIRKHLPENVVLGDAGFDGKISVTTKIEKKITKTFDIAKDKIVVENLPSEFEYEMGDPEIPLSVQITGTESAVNAIKTESLLGVVDINKLKETLDIQELSEKAYQAEVVFTLPEQTKFVSVPYIALGIQIME